MIRAAITVNGTELARCLTNVNAFVPAKSRCPAVRMAINWVGVEFTACDGYTIGVDRLTAATEGDATVYLTREAAKALESEARGAKKAPIEIAVDDDGAVTLAVGNATHEYDTTGDDEIPELFALGDRLLERLQNRAVNMPECVAFQPELFARFSKVKPCDGSTPIMDMRLNGPTDAAQIKIGPTFVGAIAPITREYAPEGTLFDD